MNLSASAALQARSIYALILRRMRSQYMGSRAGYAWAIIEPIVWVFVLKLAIRHGSASQIPPLGASYEVFFATGVVLARAWRSSAGVVMSIVTRSKKERLPSIHRMDSVYASWILEVITCGLALVIILAILQVLGFNATPSDLMICLIAFAACALLSLAFGVLFGLLIVLMPGLNHFKGILLLIIFFTSGFSFVVDRMPSGFRNIVTWNPLLHVLELFREGFYGGYECRSLDLVYLFSFTVCALLIGMAGERALRRHESGDTSEGDAMEF
ncbi:ABC transporter permease [Methylopila sp. M107]|uniref:ABC transporter permease n=1 Tax=Methylopila sp. M107 TaxID=1101190 RepID=UPI0003A19106|nr:ABC transporter permease [Methylopila sp. M107]